MKQKLPSILQGYDPRLSMREAQRILRYGDKVEKVLTHIATHPHKRERELQIFLYAEIFSLEPRPSLLYRLCASLSKIQAQQKRAEVKAYVARKRY